MGKPSTSTASSEEAVETTTNEVAAKETIVENIDVVAEEVVVEEVVVDDSEKVEVKFLLSPTRKFNLGYSVGETGFFTENEATELVEAKYAEYVK
jgi:hypothetical protein